EFARLLGRQRQVCGIAAQSLPDSLQEVELLSGSESIEIDRCLRHGLFSCHPSSQTSPSTGFRTDHPCALLERFDEVSNTGLSGEAPCEARLPRPLQQPIVGRPATLDHLSLTSTESVLRSRESRRLASHAAPPPCFAGVAVRPPQPGSPHRALRRSPPVSWPVACRRRGRDGGHRDQSAYCRTALAESLLW